MVVRGIKAIFMHSYNCSPLLVSYNPSTETVLLSREFLVYGSSTGAVSTHMLSI